MLIHHQPLISKVRERATKNKQREKNMEREIEMKVSKFKRICVFCGSSPGNKTSYKDAAIELGKELVIITTFEFFFIFLILSS